MKAEENVLHNIEAYINGKLIDGKNLTVDKGCMKIDLEDGMTEILADLLESNTTVFAHKCISVYRDAFIHNGVTYNVCLSCGDFWKDNVRYFLSREGVEAFKAMRLELMKIPYVK